MLIFTTQPVTGENFINREDEISRVINDLENPRIRTGFALFGARRVGKTSLFKEIERRLAKNNKIVPVYLSVWDLPQQTLANFATTLSLSVVDAYAPLLSLKHKLKGLIGTSADVAKKFLTEIKVGWQVKDELSHEISYFLTLGSPSEINSSELLERAFAISETLAKTHKKKTALFIDEFPDLMKLEVNGKAGEEAIIKKIRSIVEDLQFTSLNASGSIRSTMDLTLLSSGSAFYRQLVPIELNPFSLSDVTKLLREGFEGQRVDDAACEITFTLSNGLPFYVQAMGRILARHSKKVITKELVEEAYEEFLSEEGNIIFQRDFRYLSNNERKLIYAMVNKKTTSYGEIQNSLLGEVKNIGTHLVALEDKGMIEKKAKGKYEIADPVFQDWLKKKVLES